nr:MAG: hypothetical protein [Microvirus sp.]
MRFPHGKPNSYRWRPPEKTCENHSTLSNNESSESVSPSATPTKCASILTRHLGSNTMHHCLNKRNRHETFYHEQENQPEKFQKRNRNPQKEPPHDSNARRRKALTHKTCNNKRLGGHR